jgi:hypothetical protein
MIWTEPYYGVQHTRGERGPLRCYATIEDHHSFATWGIYSWRSHRWIAEGQSASAAEAREMAERKLEQLSAA